MFSARKKLTMYAPVCSKTNRIPSFFGKKEARALPSNLLARKQRVKKND
jgi:hypothetical protein